MDNSHTGAKKHGWIGKWAVVAGIVIVLNLFFNYAISLVYKEPSYDAFVPSSQVVEPITNQADCVAIGGQWTDPDPRYANPDDTTPVVGSCDPTYTKSQQYYAAEKTYNRNVFVILVVLGVASLVAGAFIANAILAIAFSWGGVFSLIIASVRYWSDASDIVHLVLLAAALAALIWVATKKMEHK